MRWESWSSMGPIFEKVIQACCCLQPVILLYSLLRYIRSNFKFIEEICKTDPGQWK